MKYSGFLLLIFCLISSTSAIGQNAVSLNSQFSDTYYYKINAQQAFRLIAHPDETPDSSLFTTTSYVQGHGSDSLPLPQANYIAVSFADNKLKFNYTPITTWRVYAWNTKNMVIQLLDLKTNQPVKVDNIHCGRKAATYDALTQSYSLKDINFDGIIAITDHNETFYFTITNDKSPSPKRLAFKINNFLKKKPLKYGADLYRFYNRCIIDAPFIFKRDQYYYSNSYRVLKNDAVGLLKKSNNKFSKKNYLGYFYFNKPKYREHDTIKFKAYILENHTKGIWYDKPVLVYLNDYGDETYLGTSYSKRSAAGYDFQFVIQDSMDISLDEKYDIVLKDLDSNKLTSDKFTYEDYELKKTVFEINLPYGEQQFKGKPFSLHFTAKDENNLPMSDTKAWITMLSENVYNIKPDQLFVPDTLWSYVTTVKNGNDSLLIPDTFFAKANIDYQLKVVMENSEHERTDLDEKVEFRSTSDELKLELLNDSIHVTAVAGSNSMIELYAEDKFDFRVADTFVHAPFSMLLNTHASTFHAENDDDIQDLDMKDFQPNINIHASRTKDSVSFALDNPRHIPVVYYLYSKGKKIATGTDKNLPFTIAAEDDRTYYLRLQYVWAGEVKYSTAYVPLFKNTVKFNIVKPQIITPGKEVNIDITATDYKDRPIKDLNLLAFSYTKKFGETDIASLPYNDYTTLGNGESNELKLEAPDNWQTALLDYRFWNAKLSLDTGWMYRFRYPNRYKISFTTLPATDSITQVAPFIMDKGAPQAIYYVLIDNIPVYFGFTDIRAAYSFQVDTGYHQYKIRTSKKLLTIDSLKVQPFVKSLFSIDQNDANVAVHIDLMPDTFTRQERYGFSDQIMKINMPYDDLQYAHLEKQENTNLYFDLSTADNYYSNSAGTTIGPIIWRYWNFDVYNRIHRSFEFEPNYTYSFNNELVKMKSNEGNALLPRSGGGKIPSINDEVLTKQTLLKSFENKAFDYRRTNAPQIKNQPNEGSCNLTIEYDKKYYHLSFGTVVLGRLNDFNFLNIYSGNTTAFRNLKAGQYQLLLVDKENRWYKTDVIEIKPNGYNFYRITHLDTLDKDATKTITDAVAALYQVSNTDKEKDVNVVMNSYVHSTYTGPSTTYTGKVSDKNNEGIPGAIIKIEGTSMGTMTDIDGNFSIDIPLGASLNLIVNTVGFASKTVKAEKNIKIKLEEDHSVLQEVTITTGYGTVSKNNYVGAADVITSRKIMKMPVGDYTKVLEGAAPGVVVTNSSGAPGSGSALQIRGRGSLSASTYPLIVVNGAPYNGDLITIDPEIIESMSILKDAEATSLYGSRGSNGVIIITTKKDAALPDNIRLALESTTPPMTTDMMVSSMRHNFRDDAYWQPDLVTDENGKASFKVTFPDDITNWQTILIGVDDKKHNGQAFGNIKSYKPVATSLYLPHFLLDGDSAVLIGKSVNYIPDTIPVTTTFYQNDTLMLEHKLRLGAYYSDTLLATATGSDSIKLKYLLTKEDGYFDGEEKTIPLERIGVKVAEGGFQALDMKDTSFSIYPTKRNDSLHLAATASLIDVVLDEIDVVRDYGYLCNEQMASKILALLSKQKLYALLNKDFSKKDKNYIDELLRKISKNQNNQHLWGWWEDGSTVPWISNHVIRAIMESKAQGYTCNIDLTPISNDYELDLERDTLHTDIPKLRLLAQSGLKLNYEKYISRLERNIKLTFNDYLELILLRQQLHLPYKLDRLKNLKEEDIFGNIYWKDTARYVYSNEVLTTVNALKILQQDSSQLIPTNKVINWLLQQRSHTGWRNTYESVQVIEAIAPYIPLTDSNALKPELQFQGALQNIVSTFPYQQAVTISSPLMIHKTGIAPVYFTWYYNKWDTTNVNLGKSFNLRSHFEINGKTIDYLPAGEPVTMQVNVQVDKSADYVMLEIPIPAGCSYQSKEQSYAHYEIHREYFENKVSIFCEKLPKGNYTFNVELLPRYEGKYTINPAKAELMYFPIFYGREMIKKIEIKP